jgi:hypothetical protein
MAPTPVPSPPAPIPTPPAVAPTPPPPPPEEPLPAKVTVALSTQPRGAVVKDLATGAVLGRTPRTFSVTPGRTPRQYSLMLRGYAEAQIEIIPNREKIAHTETLEKDEPGKSGRPKTVRPKPINPEPATTPGKVEPVTTPDKAGPVTAPDKADPVTAPGKVEPTPPIKVEPVKPPPEDDCPELPCLKGDPTRKGGGGNGG